MVSAIVLVAGFSNRMGELNKLALPFKDSTILQSTLEAIISSKFDEVVVVTSKMSFELVISILEKLKTNRIKYVVNDDPERGMTSSIHLGIHALSNKSTFGFICLADMPTIKSETYNELIDGLLKTKCGIIQPYFNGSKGNPVGFKSKYYPQILLLENSNGCGHVLETNKEQVLKYECKGSSVLVDVDDQESYMRLLNPHYSIGLRKEG